MSRYASDPSRFMPLPELLTDEPGTFEIVDTHEVRGLPTNGMVDLVNKLMVVPLDESGRVVSRHECAHVLWTEPRPPRVRGSRAYLQAVEDGRINRGLQWIGLGIELDPDSLEQVVGLGRSDLEHEEQGLVHWALRTVASYGTSAEQPLLALIEETEAPQLPFDHPLAAPRAQRVRDVVVRAHRKLERARRREGGPVASPESVQTIARWLRRELRDLGLPEPKDGGRLVCCLGAGPPHGHRGRRGWTGREAFGGSGGDGAGAGRMRISEPPLPHACPASPRGRARGRRLAAEGTLLRDVARFAHDQKVFAVRSRRRRGGGSVLIDTSGSMRLDSDGIDKIVAGAPEATLVAIYSGRERDGELRIVVRDGRRVGVDGLEPYGAANVIDLPALEWLARQPAPRVWISDGGVTGVNDSPSRSLKLRCASLCRRSGIRRVRTSGEAAKLLASSSVR